MEDTVYENHSVVEVKTSLRVRELEADLFAYKRTVDTTTSKKTGKLATKLNVMAIGPNEGIVDAKNLDLLVRGKRFTYKTFVEINAEGRELLRTHTYQESGKVMNSLNGGPVGAFDDGFDVNDLVTLNFNDYTMFDRHGEYLPTAVYGDYITAQMHNGTYDLNKAAPILLARGDVRLLSKKEGNWRDDEPDPKSPSATTVKEAIFSVPSYNSDARRSECIYYVWGPSAQEFRTLMDYCHANRRGIPSKKTKIGKYSMDGFTSSDVHKAIFDLDLLGLRQFGAAKKNNFYGD